MYITYNTTIGEDFLQISVFTNTGYFCSDNLTKEIINYFEAVPNNGLVIITKSPYKIINAKDEVEDDFNFFVRVWTDEVMDIEIVKDNFIPPLIGDNLSEEIRIFFQENTKGSVYINNNYV